MVKFKEGEVWNGEECVKYHKNTYASAVNDKEFMASIKKDPDKYGYDAEKGQFYKYMCYAPGSCRKLYFTDFDEYEEEEIEQIVPEEKPEIIEEEQVPEEDYSDVESELEQFVDHIPDLQLIQPERLELPNTTLPEEDFEVTEIWDIEGEHEMPSEISPGPSKIPYKPIKRGVQFSKGAGSGSGQGLGGKRRYNNPIKKGQGWFGKRKKMDGKLKQWFQKTFEEGGAYEEQPQESIIPFDQYMEHKPGDIQLIQFPTFHEYLDDHNPIQWEDINERKTGGITKKKFVNSLMKKAEGGDSADERIAQGSRQDTLTNEVEKIRNDFLNTIKKTSTKALSEEIYDKAQQLGDPKLMELLSGMGEESEQGVPEAELEHGGFVDPESDLYKFFEGAEYSEDNMLPAARDGGVAYDVMKAFSDAANREEDLAEDDPWAGYDIRKATKNYNRIPVPYYYGRRRFPRLNFLRDTLIPANRVFGRVPGRIKSRAARYLDNNKRYKGPYGNLTPIRTDVTKTDWRGRPKKWTDIYAEGPQDNLQELIRQQRDATKPIISLDPESQDFETQELGSYDDLKGATRRKLKRADRQFARQIERAEENPEGDVPFLINSPFKDKSRSRNGAAKKLGLGARAKMLTRKLFPNPTSKYIAEMPYGGYTQNVGVNTPEPNTMVNPQAEITNLGGGWAEDAKTFMNVNTPTIDPSMQPDNINVDPTLERDAIQDNFDDYQYGKKEKLDPNLVKIRNRQKKARMKTIDPEVGVNLALAGTNAASGIIERMRRKKRDRQQAKETVAAENLYTTQTSVDEGNYADVGSRTGLFRPGKELGQLEYSQFGGYMQEGGMPYMFDEDELEEDMFETEMTEEEIAEFIANGGELEYL